MYARKKTSLSFLKFTLTFYMPNKKNLSKTTLKYACFALLTLLFFANASYAENEQSSPSVSRAEIQRQTIDIAGRPLHFVEVYKDRETGPKPLLIFVHGTPGNWYNHATFLYSEFLRDNFHMISVDRLGHGKSTGKVEPSLQAQAASLKPLLDRDTTGNGAILIGHSLGGPIIARTAMDYLDRVSGLIFIASSGDPRRSLRWYNTVGGFLPISWFVPKELRRANREILPLKKQLKAMLPLWKNITVTTTIIQGGKDKLVNPKNADFIQQALVNAKVKTIIDPEGDHFLHWRNPQVLVDALAEFIVHKE